MIRRSPRQLKKDVNLPGPFHPFDWNRSTEGGGLRMIARQRGVFGSLFLILFLLGACSGPAADSEPQRKTSRPVDSDGAGSKEIRQQLQPAEQTPSEPVRTPAPPKRQVKPALNPPISTLPGPSAPAAT